MRNYGSYVSFVNAKKEFRFRTIKQVNNFLRLTYEGTKAIDLAHAISRSPPPVGDLRWGVASIKSKGKKCKLLDTTPSWDS